MRSFRATDRLPRGEGEELVRRVLEDLVLAHERDPHGVAGVSRAEQIPSLPPRARRAVLAALYGKLSAVLDRALEDKVIDGTEAEELRSILGAIAGEAGVVAFGGSS